MYGKTSERSEQGYIFAPGELRSAGSGEKRKGVSRHPGGLLFGDFSLAKQREVTRVRGGSPRLCAAEGGTSQCVQARAVLNHHRKSCFLRESKFLDDF